MSRLHLNARLQFWLSNFSNDPQRAKSPLVKIFISNSSKVIQTWNVSMNLMNNNKLSPLEPPRHPKSSKISLCILSFKASTLYSLLWMFSIVRMSSLTLSSSDFLFHPTFTPTPASNKWKSIKSPPRENYKANESEAIANRQMPQVTIYTHAIES